MRPSELRLGNLIKWKYGEDEYNIIHSIDAEHIDLQIITPFGVCPEDIEGIPLTEEWLLKFNWNKIDKYTFTLNGWFIYKRKRGFVSGCKKREINIKYVHVLQNWWYGNNLNDLHLE